MNLDFSFKPEGIYIFIWGFQHIFHDNYVFNFIYSQIKWSPSKNAIYYATSDYYANNMNLIGATYILASKLSSQTS